eukprot:CAMPEP_0204531036 /NCGR_PEP_ID=MMETSP0661-20131031/10953_1 /ASSEMBLY_ACC=CAM_ASM_000606 /TAXON_ID=109239 /ORGANISM="Alexandrium margalefi, Strain AMGDE01CS-322" /LENGTH=78 /DNA_ID=CAMNT_0051537165 /DNA_START=181 /DNA_END=414 /DNA_ORIENTATION=-
MVDPRLHRALLSTSGEPWAFIWYLRPKYAQTESSTRATRAKTTNMGPCVASSLEAIRGPTAWMPAGSGEESMEVRNEA